MNPGSEPERDDTGLPPIDVEIPDDARELDRDVQAYQRERRALRRHSRRFRLRGFLARDGIAMPLLACCLIFALITGTLLTVFTASGVDKGMPGAPGAGGPYAAQPAGPVGANPAIHPAGRLPAATIMVAGQRVPLQSLRSAALLLVPQNCACSATLTKLAALMSQVAVPTLLVPAAGVRPADLAQPQGAGAKLATDASGALRSYRHAGLTAVLVGPDGTVRYADRLVYGDNMEFLLAAVSP